MRQLEFARRRWTVDPAPSTVPFRYLSVRAGVRPNRLGAAYQPTKYEVPSYSRSKDINHGPISVPFGPDRHSLKPHAEPHPPT